MLPLRGHTRLSTPRKATSLAGAASQLSRWSILSPPNCETRTGQTATTCTLQISPCNKIIIPLVYLVYYLTNPSDRILQTHLRKCPSSVKFQRAATHRLHVGGGTTRTLVALMTSAALVPDPASRDKCQANSEAPMTPRYPAWTRVHWCAYFTRGWLILCRNMILCNKH